MYLLYIDIGNIKGVNRDSHKLFMSMVHLQYSSVPLK